MFSSHQLLAGPTLFLLRLVLSQSQNAHIMIEGGFRKPIVVWDRANPCKIQELQQDFFMPFQLSFDRWDFNQVSQMCKKQARWLDKEVLA